LAAYITKKPERSPFLESLKVLPLFYAPEIKRRCSEDYWSGFFQLLDKNCMLTWWSWSDAHTEHLGDGRTPGTSPFTLCLKSWTNKNCKVQEHMKKKRWFMLNGSAPDCTAEGDYTATNYDNLKGCYFPLWFFFFYISKKSNTQKL